MSGRSKREASGPFNAGDRATPTAGRPGKRGTDDLEPPAARPPSRQSSDEASSVRLAMRAVVTGAAAVGFLIAGFAISPNEVGVPSARAGLIVILTDKSATHARHVVRRLEAGRPDPVGYLAPDEPMIAGLTIMKTRHRSQRNAAQPLGQGSW